MNWTSSTHKANWLLSKEDLIKKRQELRASVSESKRLKVNSGGAGSDASELVTAEEENKLLRFYQEKIVSICAELKYPVKVKATALVYYKRFFTTCSPMEYDPVKIMLTSIYLAGKIEEAYIGAEEFCRILKQDMSTVLRSEVPLLQGLRFELVVHSPYRALAGFLCDIDDLRKAGEGGGEGGKTVKVDKALLEASDDTIAACKASSHSAVDALMMTDAPIMFPPGQLALAAMRSGFRRKGIKLTPYLEQATLRAAGMLEGPGMDEAAALQLVLSNLDEIDRLGMEGVQKADLTEVQRIDKKLKALRNPAASENAEKEKLERREAKLRARKEQQAAEEAKLLMG